jgi:hypothetical protein
VVINKFPARILTTERGKVHDSAKKEIENN